MSRAIVHKTKGRLDLRSLTVFGLNAKPSTNTPIGYFGTGLKYAVAVLARNNIPMTFWIDGKRWTIEQDDTKFRDKSFRALFLKRHTLIPKTINLPFTTELGKNWELWQAFRELEANTRDEMGITFLCSLHDTKELAMSGWTLICVEDERYVQEYFDRDKTFLPDGLTQRDAGSMSDAIQVFARKSNAIYYRSIRILDLKEPSENTYNILSQLQLTEDRTAKSEWDVNYEIERYLATCQDDQILERAITAPEKSLERKFGYEYHSPSTKFLTTVDSLGDNATDYAKAALRRARPIKTIHETYPNWIRDLIAAIKRGDNDRIREIGENEEHKAEMLQILTRAAEAKEKEDVNNSYEEPLENWGIPTEVGAERIRAVISDPPEAGSDDLPF